MSTWDYIQSGYNRAAHALALNHLGMGENRLKPEEVCDRLNASLDKAELPAHFQPTGDGKTIGLDNPLSQEAFVTAMKDPEFAKNFKGLDIDPATGNIKADKLYASDMRIADEQIQATAPHIKEMMPKMMASAGGDLLAGILSGDLIGKVIEQFVDGPQGQAMLADAGKFIMGIAEADAKQYQTASHATAGPQHVVDAGKGGHSA